MFTHPKFRNSPVAELGSRSNEDLIVMDERWMADYEREWIRLFDHGQADPYAVGYITRVAVRSVGDGWVELSWYVNINDRFHEIPLFLPEDRIVACVEVPSYGEDLHIFVRSAWLTDIHKKPLATFALVDAAGIKALLQRGALPADKLEGLRTRIDAIADRYPHLAFVSFADSILVKQIWSVGHVGSSIRYSYAPEDLLPALSELQAAITEVLGLDAYAVVTQGMNAYDDKAPLHISSGENHISLNSLGLPFAQLMAIESAARNAIHAGTHVPSGLYMDTLLLRSLKLNDQFRQSLPLWPYQSPMTGTPGATYVATSLQAILDNVDN
jgi:hypothetical protein